MSQDCNVNRPSFVISLDRLGTNGRIGATSDQIAFDTVLADFTALNRYSFSDPLLTVPAVNDEANPTIQQSGMRLLTCATGCTPRPATPDEILDTISRVRLDSIAVEVNFIHRWTSTTINPSTFEQYSIPAGGLELDFDLVVSPPTNDPSLTLSLLVAVTVGARPAPSVTLSQAQSGFMQRLQLHDGMFVDFPLCATMDSNPYAITVKAARATSGERKDLVQVLLVFGPIGAKHIRYTAAAAFSDVMLTTPPGRYLPPLLTVRGVVVPRNLYFAPRGSFAFCFDVACLDWAYQIGFRGLGSTEGVTIKRFDDSPAFQFFSGVLHNNSNDDAGTSGSYFREDTGTFESFFRASTPQARESRPV